MVKCIICSQYLTSLLHGASEHHDDDKVALLAVKWLTDTFLSKRICI